IRDLTVTGVQTCALPISAQDRLRRVSCPRPGAADLGRGHPPLRPDIRRDAPGAPARTGLRPQARPPPVPGRRRGPRGRASLADLDRKSVVEGKEVGLWGA